jgi:hypothetical protein
MELKFLECGVKIRNMKSLGKGTSRSFLKTLDEYEGKNLIFEKFVGSHGPQVSTWLRPSLGTPRTSLEDLRQ